ncbi:hypothetical protein ACLOJK_004376 [Asimina triloba]
MAGWRRETNAADARIRARDLLPIPLLISTHDNLPSSSSTAVVRLCPRPLLHFRSAVTHILSSPLDRCLSRSPHRTNPSSIFYFRPDLPLSSLFIVRLRSRSLPSIFSIPDQISPSSSSVIARLSSRSLSVVFSIPNPVAPFDSENVCVDECHNEEGRTINDDIRRKLVVDRLLTLRMLYNKALQMVWQFVVEGKNCTTQVFDYLMKSVVCNQTREIIKEFLERSKQYNLAKAEKLNIINIRPSTTAEIFPERIKDPSRDCNFFRWLDEGRNSRSDATANSGSDARSHIQKHEEIVSNFGELLHCVTALKEAHLAETADWKQKHKALKEEVRGLKEAGLRRDMEASIMKKNQSVHAILICILIVVICYLVM